MHNASFAEHLGSWDQLTGGVSSRAAEVRALTLSQREELIQARNKAWEAHLRQLAARAAAQQATRDLEAAMAEAHEVATRLRCSLWGQYGRQSPHLHAFGMRPYPRTRARAAAAAPVNEGEALPNAIPEPAPPTPAPEVKGEPSPSAHEAQDRRGAVPQREPDAQTRPGELVSDGERLPNDEHPPTRCCWTPTAATGEAEPPGTHLPAE